MAFHLTRQRNAVSICILLLLALLLLSWWLFRPVWTLFLCSMSILSYCTTSYVCYRPEATEWRILIDEWYYKLFVWSFNYHYPSGEQQGHTNDTPPTSHTPPSETTPTYSTAKSNLEGTISDPQPQASGQDGSNESVQPMKKCHKEAQKVIQLIMRDFVESWYAGVTNDTEFPEDLQKVLEHVALEINVRVHDLNLKTVVVEMLNLIHPYLEVLNKVGIRDYNGVELFDVTNEMCTKQFEADERVSHHAMKSRSHEQRYYRQALDVLLQTALPPEYSSCDITCTFIREILLKNIIEQVFELLCDPAFLYEAIPLILNKASPEKIHRQFLDINQENEELEHSLNRGRLISIMGSRGRPTKRRFFTQSASPDLSLSPRKVPQTRPHSIVGLPYMQRTSSGIYESDSWLTSSSQVYPQQCHDAAMNAETENTYPPPVHSSKFSPGRIRSKSSPYQTHTSGMVDCRIPEEKEEEEEEDENSSYEHVINGDFAMVELAPIYIERHVRVETGTGSHVAYIFKFPKWMLPDDDLKELGVLKSDTHLEGMKRYSDFCKFHDIILSSPLTIFAKGLILPDKRTFSKFISRLPFTSSEPDAPMLIERKEGLEKYLQSVSSVESIVSSEVFHQFLKSAVKDLKEANVVNPSRNKKQNRMSFLGRVRTDDTQKAKPIPKRPLESVLSSYLNTHLPLPCRFNSLDTMRRNKPYLPNLVQTSKASSMAKTESSTGIASKNGQRRYSTNSSQDLTSNASPNTSITSLNRSHTFSSIDSLHPTEYLEHTSTVIPENDTESQPTQPATEAIHDSVEATGSESSLHVLTGELSAESSLVTKGRERVEEESHTIGSYNVSLSAQEGHFSTQNMPISTTPRHRVTFAGSDPPQVKEHEAQLNHMMMNSELVLVSRVKSLLYKCLILAHRVITWTVFIIQQGTAPHSKQNSHDLIMAGEKRSPLSNSLFSLGSEVSARHCPQLWACCQDTQLALLVLAGGGTDRFLWRELEDVVYVEDNWVRCLYSLRHILWPGGVLIRSSKRKLNEGEIDDLKRNAAGAFKKFLPNFFPHIIGKEDYDRAVIHCLDCLRNPRINRHFLLRVMDLMIMKIIPEITNKNFQRNLSRVRTTHPTHHHDRTP